MRATIFVALAALAACPAPGAPLAPAPVGPTAPPPAPPVVDVRPPPPADPAPRVDGDVTDAYVHGVHVLVKRIPGAEATATQLYVLGGARTWSRETAGLEMLAIRAAVDGGTERLDRDAFQRRLSELGSTLDGYAALDFSVMYTWSLAPTWDETFGMLVGAFRHPAMPAQAFETSRARQISSLVHERETPDGRLRLAVAAELWRDHPYANRPNGTPETVRGFTREAALAHLQRMRDASRLLVVVVGDIDAKHVTDAVARAFGDLPRSMDRERVLAPLAMARAGTVHVVAEKLPTNYIEAVGPGPHWTDPDYAVARVAMDALHQREFEEVRTKRNLSYAPSAWMAEDLSLPLVGLYVTAVDPGTTMKVMYDEAKKLRDQPITDKDLAGYKSTLLTGTFTAGESPNDQATQLAQAQIHGGDWHLVRTLPDRVRAVTPAQIQAWAKAHLTKLTLFVIGDPGTLDRAMVEQF